MLNSLLGLSIIFNIVLGILLFNKYQNFQAEYQEEQKKTNKLSKELNQLKIKYNILVNKDMEKDFTTRKFIKKDLVNSLKALSDNYIYMVLMPDNSVYIKDSKNTVITKTIN